MQQILPNRPPKGTQDWWPDEFAARQFIFDTWGQVNRQFGYEQYLTPLLETADIYRAKSGADVGGKELMTLTTRGGRELALRPEMTPSVTRMVSRSYKQASLPLRLFSIANFWRSEQPQRGRNREFWQLNTDIFGSKALRADLEILQIALEIMLAFNPPAGSFVLYLNHRHLIDAVLEIAGVPAPLHVKTARLLDKFAKMKPAAFREALARINLSPASIELLATFMKANQLGELVQLFPPLADSTGYREILALEQQLDSLGYRDWFAFNPSVIRGFDYYDGMVFEVYDTHPENNRSLFGGGRYNGLGHLFGSDKIPAVGFAPGDETTRLFLESWQLAPAYVAASQSVYLPLLDAELSTAVNRLAQSCRRAGIRVTQGLETQSIRQALGYANKKRFPLVLLLGSDELRESAVTLKEMQSGNQSRIEQTRVHDALKKKFGL